MTPGAQLFGFDGQAKKKVKTVDLLTCRRSCEAFPKSKRRSEHFERSPCSSPNSKEKLQRARQWHGQDCAMLLNGERLRNVLVMFRGNMFSICSLLKLCRGLLLKL